MQSEQGRLTHLYSLINLNTFKWCKLLFENGACSTISTTVQIRLPNSRWCLRFSVNFPEHFHYEIQETYRIIRGIHHWSLETANRVRGTSRAIPKHVLPQFYRRRNGWHGERLLEHATQLVTKTAVPDEDVYRLMWNQKQDDGVRCKSIDWRLQPRQFQLPRPHHRFVSLARDRNLIN